jgi:AcrR family transcriptional regulator
MSTVAALAKVSPRTLYRYFGSKSELFAATIAEATSEFLDALKIEISGAPLRDAIINAFQQAEIEVNEESREMMRVASTDEKVWGYFLGATTRMQPALAGTLYAATGAASDSADLLWDVRAGALLSAIAAAYRRWASLPGTDLTALVAEAVDVVMPAIVDSSLSTTDVGETLK